MSRTTGVSSDIEAARNVSRRLTGLTPTGSPDDGGYITFAGIGGAVIPTSDSLDEEVSVDQDFQTWDGFLDWTLGVSHSSAVFAVDPQGFVLGARGAVSEDGFEGTGAELSYIVGQAQAMSRQPEELQSVALDFGDRRLVGLRVRMSDSQDFLLGFVEPQRLTNAVIEGVTDQMDINLGHLR